MRLRTKLAVAVVVATVLLASVVLLSIEGFKSQATGQVQTDVNETAAQSAAQVDDVVRERVGVVKFHASKPALDRPGSVNTTLDGLVDGSRFYAAQFIAANGTVVSYRGQVDASARAQTIGTDVSNEPYVASVLNGRASFHVSDIQRDPAGDVVVISAPVFDSETGNLTGVLAGAVRVGDADFFIPLRSLETGSQTVQVTAIGAGERATLVSPNRRFEDDIAGAATVDSTDWLVQVSADRAPLNSRLRTLALAQGAGILLVVGVLVGLGVWEYRVNISQTERLLDAFERLQAGEYDHSLSLSAAEEWAQISDGYRDLATSLAERERAIREREQRLGVLNRLLRHNLRNDMSVILSYAEMLPEFDDRERRETAAQKIQETGQGLVDHGEKARQIQDAMESAEDGTTTVDVVPAVERAADAVAADYAAVTVETDLPARAPATAVDSIRFAVKNLVENAAEHNDADDPWVRVGVESGEGTVRLRVADNGPGIPDYERTVLFEGQETALEHGSGVGLWLAYWVVDSCGGTVRFEDNDPRGSVVTVDLDAAAAAPLDGSEATDSQPTDTVTAVLEGETD